MAEYRIPSGVDPIEYLLNKVGNLENRLAAQEGRRLTTWDRGIHEQVAAPVEGQHMVEATDEGVWYFSNREWRQICAPYPVVRLRRNDASDTNVADGGASTIEWNEYENRDPPSMFGGLDGTFTVTNVTFDEEPALATHVMLLQPGAYMQTIVLFWQDYDGFGGVKWHNSGWDWPNERCQLAPVSSDATLDSVQSFSETFWVEDTADEIPVIIDASAVQSSGGTQILSGEQCFWEIVYLGPVKPA